MEAVSDLQLRIHVQLRLDLTELVGQFPGAGSQEGDCDRQRYEKDRLFHGLEISGVTEGRNEREQRQLGQFVISGIDFSIVVAFVTAEHEVRIHAAIDVVDAEAPDAFPAFMGTVKVDGEVEPVAGRKAVVVPVRGVIDLHDSAVRRQDGCLPFRDGRRAARREGPGAAQIDFFGKLVVGHQ